MSDRRSITDNIRKVNPDIRSVTLNKQRCVVISGANAAGMVSVIYMTEAEFQAKLVHRGSETAGVHDVEEFYK